MIKAKMFFMAAMIAVMTLGFAGMASAATIACGDCHGTTGNPLPTDADNCANTGNALHGVHVNYSSAAMPKTVASYGKCGYCHTATATKAPTSLHINNYVNVTSSAKAPGLDYTVASATCTNSCHKNEAATAKWGNYTSVSIKLSCNSCHDDVAASSQNLSGAHTVHFTTAVNTGGTAMGAASNAGCVACHPNNVNDWVKLASDNGSGKAYPHAADGTNVVSDNASLIGGISATRGAGSTDTCATSCHPRSATIQWGQTMTCDSCHYQNDAPTSAGNIGSGLLGGSHNAHFNQSVLCTDCHGTKPVGTAHASAMPIVADNATITRTGMSFDDGANTCSFTSNGTACHGNGNTTPAWSNPSAIPSCAICHNYPTVAGKDWAAGNGHAVRYDAPVVNTHLKASGFDASGTTTYATQVGVGGSCNTCHSGATHRNGTTNVAGNGNSACNTNFGITVTTPGSNVTCSDVKCHSGKVTPNWW